MENFEYSNTEMIKVSSIERICENVRAKGRYNYYKKMYSLAKDKISEKDKTISMLTERIRSLEKEIAHFRNMDKIKNFTRVNCYEYKGFAVEILENEAHSMKTFVIKKDGKAWVSNMKFDGYRDFEIFYEAMSAIDSNKL